MCKRRRLFHYCQCEPQQHFQRIVIIPNEFIVINIAIDTFPDMIHLNHIVACVF